MDGYAFAVRVLGSLLTLLTKRDASPASRRGVCVARSIESRGAARESSSSLVKQKISVEIYAA
jgi:hypothetical protein